MDPDILYLWEQGFLIRFRHDVAPDAATGFYGFFLALLLILLHRCDSVDSLVVFGSRPALPAEVRSFSPDWEPDQPQTLRTT